MNFDGFHPLHFVKNNWQNAVPLGCMVQVGPPSLHYCCAVVLRSSIVLPPVSHSSSHEYHCCQLTGQSSGVSNFYHNFKVFMWLTFLLLLILLLLLPPPPLPVVVVVVVRVVLVVAAVANCYKGGCHANMAWSKKKKCGLFVSIFITTTY